MGRAHMGGRGRGHRALGRAHAELVWAGRRLAGERGRPAGGRGRLPRERGQGTVEYVALIILMALLLAAVVSAVKAKGDAGIATTIVDKLKAAIEGVGDPPSRR
jgi:hypothetical protein